MQIFNLINHVRRLLLYSSYANNLAKSQCCYIENLPMPKKFPSTSPRCPPSDVTPSSSGSDVWRPMRSNQVPLGCSDVFCSSVWPRQVLPSVSPPPAVSRCGAWSVSGSQNPEFGLGSGQAMEDAVKKKREERSEPINTIQGQVAQGIFSAGPNDVSYNKVSPVVENTLERVSQVVDSVKTKMKEQVLPHIPTKIIETVQTYQEASVDQVIAAVEKVDTIACGGIDQLTEKVPQLKDTTPKLIEETKSSVLSFVTRWSEYFASFSVALVALNIVDFMRYKLDIFKLYTPIKVGSYKAHQEDQDILFVKLQAQASPLN